MTDLHEEAGTLRYKTLSQDCDTGLKVSKVLPSAVVDLVSDNTSKSSTDIELQTWPSAGLSEARESPHGMTIPEGLRLGVIKLHGHICTFHRHALSNRLRHRLIVSLSLRIDPFP